MDKGDIFRKAARPIGFTFCIVTLCLLAVFETAGMGETPIWALGVLIPIAGEWLIERGVTKRKESKVINN